jgi:hypothetical protein
MERQGLERRGWVSVESHVGCRALGGFQANAAIAAAESDFQGWREDPDIGGDPVGAIVQTVFPEARFECAGCSDQVRQALKEIDLEPL